MPIVKPPNEPEETLWCGCVIAYSPHGQHYFLASCPLHKNAEKLLAAAKAVWHWHNTPSERGATDLDDVLKQLNDVMSECVVCKIREDDDG